MTSPGSYALEPARDLSVNSFNDAIEKVGPAEFYILACHIANRETANAIKQECKTRFMEVDLILRESGSPFAWFVHGMNNQGPPFLVNTVHSHVFA